MAEAGLYTNVAADRAAGLPLTLVGPVVVDDLMMALSFVAGSDILMGAMCRHVAGGHKFPSERQTGMGQRRTEHQGGKHDQEHAHCGNHQLTMSD